MTRRLTRRRFLAVSAAAMTLPYGANAKPAVARWRGIALGANASMTLVGLEDAAAREIFTAVEAEIARLEAIFSLHRGDSALSRLNQSGKLRAPPPELLELIALSGALHRATNGAFDPTIQPLWQLHARRAAEGLRPRHDEIAEAQRRSGWRYLRSDTRSLSFDRPGMALTFNGIAQGYIADRVAALLRARGLTDVLIDMGEIAALGRRPDGAAWRAGIALPEGGVVREVTLGERALATSAPHGTLLDRAGEVGHILDPRSGRPAGRWQLVSVAAGRAALADGLSTAFCLMDEEAIATILAAYPDATLEALL